MDVDDPDVEVCV